MKTKLTSSFILAAVLFLQTALAGVLTGREALQKISGAEKIITGTKSEVPEFVVLRQGSEFPVSKIKSWVKMNYKLGSAYDLQLLNTETDNIGFTHYRYQETWNGFPVTGSMLIVHVKNNLVTSVNGVAFNRINTTSSASLSESSALQNALHYMNASLYRWQEKGWEQQLKSQTGNPSATFYPKGELMLAPVKGKFNDASYRLAYRFDVYAEVPLKREYVFVDAQSGEIIYTQNRIQNSNTTATANTAYSGTRTMNTDSVNTTTYRLRETVRGMGVETYNLLKGTSYAAAVDFTDADNFWNNVNANQDQYASDAHWGAEMTYDFYWNKFGRNSIDNAGMKMLSYVHYSTAYTNAFWDGTEMTYGDGSAPYTPLTSLDVTGHEISHGVTERTSGLIYADESGAMNEGFSDCMGNSIRYYGKNPATVDWLIGDEIGGTPFRNMANPNQYQNPDCYNGTYWNAPNEVHNNSGVLNFWYYLLAEGGSGTNDIGNAYTVAGLGIDNAAKICYRMNTVYLTPSSTYADARVAALQAAIDLFGPCTPEVQSTANAWHAVGVGNAFTIGVTSDFVASITNFCAAPATVNFSNLSSNAGYYHWDFGDGDTSNAVNPTHVYLTPGHYTVTLYADGGSCGNDTKQSLSYINIDASLPCIVILPATGLGDTQTSCTGTLYDNGGAAANYTDLTNSSITISPTGASTVTLTFTSFNYEATFDYIYVYDGPTTASPLIGQYDGTALPNGGSITSTTGSITLRQTSDESLNFSGFVLNWQCTVATAPPTPNFNADRTSSCDGTIHFTDRSTNGPTSWLWDFGDGQTSTQQNPTHYYATNNIYSVTLTATNANGSNFLTLPNYITINRPDAPASSSSTTICTGNAVTLNATGATQLIWYDAPTAGTILGTGNSLVTPVLTSTTTYYVESNIAAAVQNAGPVSNAFGTGSAFANTNYHDVIFDCFAPVKLISVRVYATGAGSRTITLINSGVTIQTITVNIPDGESVVPLNFDVPVGTNLELGCAGNVNLYRNQSGAVYPYTLAGVVTLTGSNAGTPGFYYYFYDWVVQGAPCVSPRTPVVVTVDDGPIAAFTSNVVGGDVTFTDNSAGAVSWTWDFGDLSAVSNLQSPQHTYLATGTYHVKLIVSDGLCTDTITQDVVITSVGIAETASGASVSVFPNPVSENLAIRFNNSSSSWTLTLTNVVGQNVASMRKEKSTGENVAQWNLASLAPGVYTLTLMNDEGERLVKQVVRR